MRPTLGFLEALVEDLLAAHGCNQAELLTLRSLYPIGLHGAGLSLGSAHGVDPARLAQLAELVERIEPIRVSDHAGFSPEAHHALHPTAHAAHLRPLPLNEASMTRLAAHIQQVQDRLKRQILIENLSSDQGDKADTIPEPDFLAEVCRRSGCQLLLDLNHLVVRGLNRARKEALQAGAPPFDEASALRQARAQALDVVWSLPPHIVGQLHLSGFRWPDRVDQLIVDDHSQRVSPTVWDVYEQALAHLGERPTLIEWEQDLPPLAVLLDEARLAAQLMAPSAHADHGA